MGIALELGSHQVHCLLKGGSIIYTDVQCLLLVSLQRGMLLHCRITKIEIERFQVELSSKTSDLMDKDNKFRYLNMHTGSRLCTRHYSVAVVAEEKHA